MNNKNNIFYCKSEEEFIEKKYNLHQLDKYGMNALFHSELEKSIWLIKHGIDMYHQDYDNNNVMMFISSADMDKAHYLLDIGYDLSDFIRNPEKLILGRMRSSIVSDLIKPHILEQLKKMVQEEREKITSSLTVNIQHTIKKRL